MMPPRLHSSSSWPAADFSSQNNLSFCSDVLSLSRLHHLRECSRSGKHSYSHGILVHVIFYWFTQLLRKGYNGNRKWNRYSVLEGGLSSSVPSPPNTYLEHGHLQSALIHIALLSPTAIAWLFY